MRTPQMNAKTQGGKLRLEIYDTIGPSWSGMIDAKSVSAALRAAGAVTEIELRTYEPSSFLEDDMDATGYLFDVSLDYELKLDRMTLDAREPDLRGQMADELRRVAQAYLDAANAVESKLPGEEESEPKTCQPHEGQPAENMPPIRVGIFRQGELLKTTELPHPAVAFAKQWNRLSLPNYDDDELRVLPDEPRD